ncbi:MAG TPA: methylmalonyl Co-A mutase-associated GTPase MeaB [Desulfobacteraceae bacterium]|nr:methylmalonyl Co-A mutase-associated GTPase MeaB [Desulfobacteraceae bacterium]HPJ68570.1 methylmalonyl Co-A mutase-associated GTPase MeaB [Desulfobacteraceae bacterium]
MVNSVIKRIVGGDVRAAAKLIRDIEDGVTGTRETLKALHRHTGKAYVIGITGAPGVGKSTLVDQMIYGLRVRGKTVGVLAVDPTSPFSGGAILGDRIRMQRHSLDEGVFVRSLATRGQFGGLTQSTRSAIDVMDAMGKDYIIVETVGVGQDEVDIAKSSDITVIVVVPGMGDHIQAIKAGIFEVGDIFVINKADRPDAGKTFNDLKTMFDIAKKRSKRQDWEPPILMAEAANNKGIAELLNEVEKYRKNRKMLSHEAVIRHEQSAIHNELLDMIKNRLIEDVLNHITNSPDFKTYLDCIMDGTKDPYSVCDELLSAKLSLIDDEYTEELKSMNARGAQE